MSRKRAIQVNNDNIYQLVDPETNQPGNWQRKVKKKTWTIHDLKQIKPITAPLREMCDAFIDQQKNLVAYGYAGTGKSLMSIYLAISEILDKQSNVDKLIIVRSSVPSRDIGFLPGTEEEKLAVYERPYHDIFAELFGRKSTFNDMKEANIVQFLSSSFIRGLTWDNAIIFVDEFQNMTLSELDGIITRVGRNSKIILAGDVQYQQDLSGKKEQSGGSQLLKIASAMKQFKVINFTIDDIVRSGFVKSWITARDQLKI